MRGIILGVVFGSLIWIILIWGGILVFADTQTQREFTLSPEMERAVTDGTIAAKTRDTRKEQIRQTLKDMVSRIDEPSSLTESEIKNLFKSLIQLSLTE